ncbi:hypothetical protein DE146DRAFT_768522 [Phaeosphaeria sp. MPI-PUGE-AT-0046c]|nr:hypothetical protein DE146DRAFT_768522 [Phaeosphaeria sp. MPI-PUGE-AT-0046c]
MAFAPPVRRGDFLFSSVLYADPGNNNRHSRASVAELAALLRPEAPRLYSMGRKPGESSFAKDPPWHFYTAQLIHYGLPVTKDKNTAKMSLLTAMNQFKLEIPAWILKLESELKKEWETEDRKMKKSGHGGTSTANKSNKSHAKTSDSAPNGVNVTANRAVHLSLSSGLSAAEQLTLTPTESSPSKRKRNDRNLSPSAAQVEKPSTPTKRVKKGPASWQTTPRDNYEHAMTSYGTSSPLRSKQEYDSSPSRLGRNSNTSNRRDQAILLGGTYTIDCAVASDMFQDYNLDLTLAPDPSRNTWWATYRWGAWDGIIQMRPGPTGVGQPCSLGWRLRDLGTGDLKFGKRCTGTIMFLENQAFTGSLFEVPGVGTVDFDGTRLPGPSVQHNLQYEWDAFVSEAYGR